ncbi:SixA phosphatase family protein [Polycladidibacter stylochi]|uniref:SixA phosphatase family protein n=1 Tax=Polycladidibacter stylochi TaxID=1807766 RepID=UPI00082D3D88|nr:histidine phosphatase family protein [Pseudovibrio stylochi]
MLRLILIRHAKSDWGDARLEDHKRPLNEEGFKAAKALANHMRSHNLIPDQIICSTALRTRQTLQPMLECLQESCRISLLEDLYDPKQSDYLESIGAFGGLACTLMLIGHLPAIQQTALDLCGTGNPQLIEEIEHSFPTAAMAIIDFERARWSELARQDGRIVSFIRPKQMDTITT